MAPYKASRRSIVEGAGAVQNAPVSSILSESLASLRDRLREVWADGADTAPNPFQLGEAFAQAGDRLAAGCVAPLDVAAAGLRRRFGDMALPFIQAPDLSVILRARADIAATVRVLAALARGAALEVLLLDDGSDPRTALLRVIAPHLVIVNDGDCRGARGRRVVLLDDATEAPSAAGLASLPSDPARIAIGPMVMDLALRTGVADRLEVSVFEASGTGLQLCADRQTFSRLGGLDPAIAGREQAILDFCLRAHAAASTIESVAA